MQILSLNKGKSYYKRDQNMKNKSPKIIKFLFPTFANILWMATFIITLIQGRRMMNQDGDLGFHLTLGRYILDQRNIPLHDMFSHTMIGKPVTQHEWLSGLIFAITDRLFRFEGIIFLCALLTATTFWFVYKLVRAKSQNLIVSIAVVSLTIITSMVHWLARPHLFTFLLLAVWMLILHQLREGKLRRWWMLPVLMLLWTNLHGAFIVGFITWFIYGIGVGWDAFRFKNLDIYTLPPNFWRYYLLSGITSFFVSLINPSGLGLWKTVITHIGNKYLADHTLEFQSPNFHWISFWPFLVFIGFLVVILGSNKKKMRSGDLLNAAAWLLLGLYGARNVPLFAIVTAPLLAQGLDNLLLSAVSRFRFMNYLKNLNVRLKKVDSQLKGYFWPILSIIIVIAGLSIGFRFDYDGEGYSFDPEVFPVHAVNWLEENPQEGEMFNYYTWGGYLLHRLWPENRVYIDGKVDFYGEDFTRQYAQVIWLQKGWEDVLDQYNVSWVIFPPNEPAAGAIQSELGWELIYEDDTAVIIRR